LKDPAVLMDRGADFPALVKQAWESFGRLVPYNRAIGMELVKADPEWSVVSLPYREEFIGDPESGVVHGGMVSALLDVGAAFSVFSRLKALRMMATLDLRIDYLKPATPGKALVAGAVCHKITSDLAFVRGAAYHESPSDAIASVVGIYIFTDEAPARVVGGL